MVLDRNGSSIHKNLDDKWRFAPENQTFREKVMETVTRENGEVENRWVGRRPIPATDTWFETTWAAFRDGEIYR